MLRPECKLHFLASVVVVSLLFALVVQVSQIHEHILRRQSERDHRSPAQTPAHHARASGTPPHGQSFSSSSLGSCGPADHSPRSLSQLATRSLQHVAHYHTSPSDHQHQSPRSVYHTPHSHFLSSPESGTEHRRISLVAKIEQHMHSSSKASPLPCPPQPLFHGTQHSPRLSVSSPQHPAPAADTLGCDDGMKQYTSAAAPLESVRFVEEYTYYPSIQVSKMSSSHAHCCCCCQCCYHGGIDKRPLLLLPLSCEAEASPTYCYLLLHTIHILSLRSFHI